jgi:hypothetical protein
MLRTSGLAWSAPSLRAGVFASGNLRGEGLWPRFGPRVGRLYALRRDAFDQ